MGKVPRRFLRGVKNIESVNQSLSAAHWYSSWLHTDSVTAFPQKKGRAGA